MVLGLGWPRGVGMVRKWKWYPLTYSPFNIDSVASRPVAWAIIRIYEAARSCFTASWPEQQYFTGIGSKIFLDFLLPLIHK